MTANVFRRQLSSFQAFLVLAGGFVALAFALTAVVRWIEVRNPSLPWQPAQFGKRTLQLVRESEDRRRSTPSENAEEQFLRHGDPERVIEYLLHRVIKSDTPVRVARRRFGSVYVYLPRSRWEDLPYPDRPQFLEFLASNWCTRVESTVFTTFTVRDIRSGDELASCRCPTPPN